MTKHLSLSFLIVSITFLIFSSLTGFNFILPSILFVGSLVNYIWDKTHVQSTYDELLEFLKNHEALFDEVQTKISTIETEAKAKFESYEDDLRRVKNSADLAAQNFLKNTRKPTI